jgi:ABC-type uncharacterized transport system substrate-binding protein
VDYSVTVLLADDAVDAIRITWTFDDLFSGFILQEFDRDRNQALSPEEVRQIEQKHLTEFQRQGYYTTVNVNGKPVVLPSARGFRASVVKGIVTYEFVLSIKASLATTTALEVLADDPVYYIAYMPTAVTPQAQTVGAYALDCRIVKDRSGATPDLVRCGVRRR